MPRKTRNPAQTPKPDASAFWEDSPHQDSAQGGHFYGVRLTNSESRKRLARADRVQGVDQELAILRWRLEELIAREDKKETRDHSLVLKTIELIVRAYSAKERASDDSNAPTEKGIENLLRDASRKFGLKTIPWNSTR